MSKIKVELNELNKLYDEIYYSNFDGVEIALDIVSNIISEKENEDQEDTLSGLSNIIDVIVRVLDETLEAFDAEGLLDVSNHVKEKIDKVQSGENDDIIENAYINYLSEDYDEDLEDEELYDMDDDYDDDPYEDDY